MGTKMVNYSGKIACKVSYAIFLLIIVILNLNNLRAAPGGGNPPTFNTTPSVTTVNYGTAYSYSFSASVEGALATTLSAPTLPAWLAMIPNGESNASLFGNVPTEVYLSGVAGDDAGNTYAIRRNGTEIFKITPDGTTTSWKSALISGSVYALHIADGYIYIPRHANATNSITRIPLSNASASEETFASFYGGALSLTVTIQSQLRI